MGAIKQEATFRGYVMDGGISKTSGGFPQYVMACQAVEQWDEEDQVWVDLTGSEAVEITAYQCLFGGNGEATLSAQQIMKIFGWSGKSFSELANLDVSQTAFQFRTEEHEYEGKTSLQVTWIDVVNAIPGRQVRKLDVAEVKDLDGEFAQGLKGLGGTTVNRATPKAKKPKPGIVTQTRKPKPPMTEATVKDAFDKAIETDGNPEEIAAIVAEDEAADDKAIVIAAKKAKLAADKAAKTTKKTSKKKVPLAPPASVTKTAEKTEETAVEECTKQIAWDDSYEHKSPAVDDDAFLKVWSRVVRDYSGIKELDEDDFTDADWSAIRSTIHGEIGVPF